MHICTRVHNREGNVQKKTFIRFEASTKRFLIDWAYARTAHTLPSMCNAHEKKNVKCTRARSHTPNETGNFFSSCSYRFCSKFISYVSISCWYKTTLFSQFICACFVSWRSSVSRLHTFIIFIFPLFGCANEPALIPSRLFFFLLRLMRRFSKFFAPPRATITSTISTFRFSFYSWDRLLTTRRSQGVKSKYWNNKNYLFLYHILSHSAWYRPCHAMHNIYTNCKWISLPTLKYWMGTAEIGYDQRIAFFSRSTAIDKTSHKDISAYEQGFKDHFSALRLERKLERKWAGRSSVNMFCDVIAGSFVSERLFWQIHLKSKFKET